MSKFTQSFSKVSNLFNFEVKIYTLLKKLSKVAHKVEYNCTHCHWVHYFTHVFESRFIAVSVYHVFESRYIVGINLTVQNSLKASLDRRIFKRNLVQCRLCCFGMPESNILLYRND